MLNSNRLANVAIVAANNHHPNSSNNFSTNKHVLHKHSQSLDATGPYIPISECHTGESFIQKQIPSKQSTMCSLSQKHRSLKLNTYEQQFPSSLTQTHAYQKNDNNHLEKSSDFKNPKIVLHGRSSSNIVLGSKQQQQYGHSCQQSNHNFTVSSNIYQQTQKVSKNSSLPQFNVSNSHDFPTNRHFKVYEKIRCTREVSNSTSLLDVSCLEKKKNFCNLNCNFNSINQYCENKSLNLKKSDLKLCETNSLSDALSELSVNSQLKNSNFVISDQPPPRPPKPLNLRTTNFSQNNSSNNNSSFNECFSNNPSLISDEEYSPSFKDNLYPQSNNQLYHTRPKNSISSSCSSNASPFCTYGNNQQDLVFIYDQPLSYHSSASFNYCDSSESYDNSSNLNHQCNQFQSNNKFLQKNSSANSTSISGPPIVDRNLKPRKNTTQNKNTYSWTNNKSQVQEMNTFYMSNSFACETEEEQNILSDEKPCLDEFYYKADSDAVIQYLDLDLENSNSNLQLSSTKEDAKENQQNQLNSSFHSNEYKETSTVYKTVDFVKTNAFNKLRSNIENRQL